MGAKFSNVLRRSKQKSDVATTTKNDSDVATTSEKRLVENQRAKQNETTNAGTEYQITIFKNYFYARKL